MGVELGFRPVKCAFLVASLLGAQPVFADGVAAPNMSHSSSIEVIALPDSTKAKDEGSILPNQFIYQIHLNDDNPNQALIEVDTSLMETSFWSAARSLGESDPVELTCHNGAQTNSLPYEVTQSCDKVSWPITFTTAPELGLDASAQVNSYFPVSKSRKKPWYLLTEWHSLPRLKTSKPIKVCFDTTHCQGLPTLTEAPLFMTFNMPKHELSLYKQPLALFTDVPALLENQQQWLPIMEEQMGYLMGVFSAYRTKPWSLVALGREVSAGSIGGAAGNRVFMTNVPLEKGELQVDALNHFLKISAHESLHFISSVDSPIWLSESLAEYYAQKSLVDTEYAFPDPVQVWRKKSEKLPVASTGLYLASDKVSKQGLMQYYPLFYLKGTAFWLDLDLHLQRKQRSLDNYVSLLQMKSDGSSENSNQTEEGRDVRLPVEFVEAVSDVIGKSIFNKLEARYLLSPIE
ncbi:hypothetical protein [Vibrio tapetis]|uniref:Uncharacterized protein n=1 Tax=Vibrio tapetis subsp. tapetis TaxID=1671868 RepID=A0A2N8ZJ44_9VIBR|nr:hypothetical protein [Vibrio tapetis]SON51876.1 conserved exported protein of unknown function [Vibrio tapetis subsp. tapetis]